MVRQRVTAYGNEKAIGTGHRLADEKTNPPFQADGLWVGLSSFCAADAHRAEGEGFSWQVELVGRV